MNNRVKSKLIVISTETAKRKRITAFVTTVLVCAACVMPTTASAAYNGQELEIHSAHCAYGISVAGYNQNDQWVVQYFSLNGCGYHVLSGWWWWGTLDVTEFFPGYYRSGTISVPRNDGSPFPYVPIYLY